MAAGGGLGGRYGGFLWLRGAFGTRMDAWVGRGGVEEEREGREVVDVFLGGVFYFFLSLENYRLICGKGEKNGGVRGGGRGGVGGGQSGVGGVLKPEILGAEGRWLG